MLEFDVAWSHFDVAWGHFDVAWQKLWLKNDVFDEILGCAGDLTSPEKKWAPVAIKVFYKYAPSPAALALWALVRISAYRPTFVLSSPPPKKNSYARP